MEKLLSASSGDNSHAAILNPDPHPIRPYRTIDTMAPNVLRPVDTNQPLRRTPARKQKKRPTLVWGLPLEQQTALTLTFYFQTLVAVKRAESALKVSSAPELQDGGVEHWREVNCYYAQAVEQYNTAVTRLLYFTIHLERHPESRGSADSLWKSIEIVTEHFDFNHLNTGAHCDAQVASASAPPVSVTAA